MNKIDLADKILEANRILVKEIEDSVRELANEYEPNGISEKQLLETHVFFSEHLDRRGIKWKSIWNDWLPNSVSLRRAIKYGKNCSCSTWGGPKHWCGEVSKRDQPNPNKENVVYVLFDEEGNLCYIGSTGDFPTRIREHMKTKSFTRWTAYECETREGAYELEDKLIKSHKPYLNSRMGR